MRKHKGGFKVKGTTEHSKHVKAGKRGGRKRGGRKHGRK